MSRDRRDERKQTKQDQPHKALKDLDTIKEQGSPALTRLRGGTFIDIDNFGAVKAKPETHK